MNYISFITVFSRTDFPSTNPTVNAQITQRTATITHKCLVRIGQTGFLLRFGHRLSIAAGIDILLCKLPDVFILHNGTILIKLFFYIHRFPL